MPARRATIRRLRGHALHATRMFSQNQQLVYVIQADKKLQYEKGRSRIAYIGTTQKGSGRVAESAAERGSDVLALRGVREFTVRIVTCKGRQGVKMWIKLEHALLWTFLCLFGRVPKCNSPKRTQTEADSYKYFKKRGLARTIDELS